LRVAVWGCSIFGRVVRRQRVPVFEGQRLPSTGSRWDIRWVSGREKTWFFVYLASRLCKGVLRLTGWVNSISGRVIRRLMVPLFEGHRLPSIGSRYVIRWVSGRGLRVFACVLSFAAMEGVLRLAVRGNSSSGRVVRRSVLGVPVFEGHRLPSNGSRWDIYGG
jgi:hypothetical protein